MFLLCKCRHLARFDHLFDMYVMYSFELLGLDYFIIAFELEFFASSVAKAIKHEHNIVLSPASFIIFLPGPFDVKYTSLLPTQRNMLFRDSLFKKIK